MISLSAMAVSMVASATQPRTTIPAPTPPPIVRAPLPPPPVRQGLPQETTVFSRSGQWTIAVDRTLGNGCFLMTGYVDGTGFRIGFSQLSQDFYFFFGNDAWRSLRHGEQYDIVLRFNNVVDDWNVRAETMVFPAGDTVYLASTIGEPDFLAQFMRAQYMNVLYRNRQIVSLDLRGAGPALTELARCQEANPLPPDPFAE